MHWLGPLTTVKGEHEGFEESGLSSNLLASNYVSGICNAF